MRPRWHATTTAAGRAVALFGLVVLSLPFEAWSQSEPPAAAAEEPEPAPEPRAPAAIPRADVTARADELATNLRRVEALLAPSEDIAVLDVSLGETTPKIQRLRSTLDAMEPSRVSLRVLQDHRVDWNDMDALVTEWIATVQDRFHEVAELDQELQRARAIWHATGERAGEDGSPTEIIFRIVQELDRIDEVAAQRREREEALASLIDRLSSAKQACTNALERLDVIETDVRNRLLTRNATPIWEWSRPSVSDFVGDASEARRYWLETLTAYVSARRPGFFGVLLCFFTFLLGAVVFRRWEVSWPSDDTSLDPARHVLSRPVSMSIAFALVVMVLAFDRVVGPVQDVIEFLSIVPIVRLGSGLLPRMARHALYWSVGLLLVNRFWTLAPDGTYLRRVLLLGATMLALYGAWRIYLQWRSEQASNAAKKGVWWSFAWALLVGATALLAVAGLANLLGWSNLAEGIVSAVFETAATAVAWAVVALSIDALGPTLFRTRLPSVLPSIGRRKATLSRGAYYAVTGFALFMFLRSTSRRFQLNDDFALLSETVLSASVTVGGLEISVGRVMASFGVLVTTWIVSRVARFVLREEILPRTGLPIGSGASIVSVVNYTVWGSGLLVAAAAAGLSATQLTVAFGALGVGIGFGLQNVVSNFVSGLILIFERPIKVGDRVQTKDHFGVITGIGIRASTIKKFDGAEVLVPNSDLVTKELVNWTRSDQIRRVEVLVRSELGSDPKLVLQLLLQAASVHPKTLETPAPSAFMTGFGESSLDFQLFVWAGVADILVVGSDLRVAIKDAFEHAGIRIPVPERDLRVSNEAAGEFQSPVAVEAASGSGDG